MSVTVSTPNQICNSPLNSSSAKMLFSFPKANRFGADIKPVCAHAFYDLPPIKSARSPGFGYGTKYDFTQNQVDNPAPTAYKVTSSLEPSKKKGFSFGLSREAMAVTGGQFVGDKTSPGPGAYDTREANKVRIGYTFKSRTAGSDALTTQRHVPGPGAYPPYVTITPKGQYFVSKFKNSQSTTFAPPRSARFPEIRDGKYPGPGSYDNNAALSPSGEYFVSKFHDSMVRSFSKGSRTSTIQTSLQVAPGPGSYRLPSDFGFYESKNAPKTARESTKTGKAQTKEAPQTARDRSPEH